MKWAIEQAPPMPAQLVATLAGLANHADTRGRGAYPSLAKLAAYTCKSERSVRRDLRQLEELKLIRPGDPAKVAHLPPDRRPEVYDLAVERTVPGGRAGPDEGTRASARTLASTRARGGKTKPSSDTYREDAGVRADVHVRPDVDVTNGGTWASQRGDAHVTNGGTPTSAKPSVEPPTNHQTNQERAEAAPEPAAPTASGGLHPIPDDFHLNDTMRRWAASTFPGLDPDFETQQFVSYWRSEGRRKRNWHDAWQKWIRDSAQRASQRAQGAFLVPLPGGNDRQQRNTNDLFDRAMARAKARMQQESG